MDNQTGLKGSSRAAGARLLLGVGLALGLWLGSTSAEAKPSRRPVVCADYAIVPDPKIAELDIAVCYDKHTAGGLVLRYWTEMVLPGPMGLSKVVVGYR